MLLRTLETDLLQVNAGSLKNEQPLTTINMSVNFHLPQLWRVVRHFSDSCHKYIALSVTTQRSTQ